MGERPKRSWDWTKKDYDACNREWWDETVARFPLPKLLNHGPYNNTDQRQSAIWARQEVRDNITKIRTSPAYLRAK
jgi:hypothetical protein